MGCKQSTLKNTTTAPAPSSPARAVVVAAPAAVVCDASPVSAPTPAREPSVPVVAEEPAPAAPIVDPSPAPSPRKSQSASPRRVFGERAASVANTVEAAVEESAAPAPPVSFSDYIAMQENVDIAPKRKVAFDAETMRKSAPKSAPAPSTLTKKQKEMMKKNHVSTGRRGPVASKWEKGSKSQMQTDKYLEMAAAFERMLTNAETINAHLDSR